ncbi:hypothetical protein WA026_009403 [Henosepilachna vigintioctopunctata]|uniref:H15 domain-containing protein n=1 Tax=Henosepilachna vigintioctopunctata TaxID=420089 RepID=A0AAW1U4H9_9CUCU
MKKVASPRHLPHVLQAIEDLGDAHGSTTRRIMDQVENANFNSSDRPKNLTTEVRKALKYALDNGLVKERGGRFAVSNFYGSSKKADPSKSIFECRRRRKRGEKKRRRRRHRRHASMSSLSDSDAPDDWESDRDLSYSRSRSRSPVYETTDGIISHRGRRRRRRSKEGRRRRRGRRHDLDHQLDDVASPRGIGGMTGDA